MFGKLAERLFHRIVPEIMPGKSDALTFSLYPFWAPSVDLVILVIHFLQGGVTLLLCK
jgi:hypothetical protein